MSQLEIVLCFIAILAIGNSIFSTVESTNYKKQIASMKKKKTKKKVKKKSTAR